MKTTGISVFVPINYGEHAGVIEHTQTVGGKDVLRSVTFGVSGRRYYPHHRDHRKGHSFSVWFAAMMRNDYSPWCQEGVTQ